MSLGEQVKPPKYDFSDVKESEATLIRFLLLSVSLGFAFFTYRKTRENQIFKIVSKGFQTISGEIFIDNIVV